jgi:hypothetical protein
MEEAKQNLSEIITLINNSFPDENDLKGFLGISKAIITDTLIESEALLVKLKEFDNCFETIFLKRELSEIFEKLRKDIEDKFDKIKPPEFNSILKKITKIRFLIKDAYVAVSDSQPLRTEAEIIKANEELKLLNSNIDDLKQINVQISELQHETIGKIASSENEIKTRKDETLKIISKLEDEITTTKESTVKDITSIYDEVKTLKDLASVIITDFQEKQKTSTENKKTIEEFLEKMKTEEASISVIQKNTVQWQQEIEKTKEEILVNNTQYKELNSKLQVTQASIDTTYEKLVGKNEKDGSFKKGYIQETEDLKNGIASFLADQKSKFSAQFNEIESLLPGATSTGLAEAYQVQKKSYTKPLQLWSGVFIGTISIMIILSIILIWSQFNKTQSLTLNEAFISLLKDLPFFIPTIWLAGYASKQQSQYKRLQQEYAFKETNAKSFHGHKMQIEELMKDGASDKDLLLQLVSQLVEITSQNPSETLDNRSHEDNSPIFKLAEKIIPTFPRAKKGQEAKE